MTVRFIGFIFVVFIYRSTPAEKTVRECKIEVSEAYEASAHSLATLDFDPKRPYTVFHFWGCAGTIEQSAKMSEKMRKPYLKKVRTLPLVGDGAS